MVQLSPQMIAVSILVSGKVQGVFFRQATLEKAKSLQISGFVRNLADGSVYIEAMGNNAAILEFYQWCHKGPLLAKVEKVTMEPIALLSLADFSISR